MLQHGSVYKWIFRHVDGSIKNSERADPGERVAPESRKGAQGVDPCPLEDPFLAERFAGLREAFLEVFEKSAGRFFFIADFGGEVLRNTSWERSSMIHSQTSPCSNSMARAIAAGKLMYHCSLFSRLMSWTAVG